MVAAALRRIASRSLETLPLYRLLPRGDARTYAGVRYHGRHASAVDICDHVERSGVDPSRHFSTAWIVADAAFGAGRDALAEQVLAAAVRRFPDVSELHTLWADLLWFQGDYDRALHHAQDAWLLAPDSRAAAAKVVRLHYPLRDVAAANRVALDVLERFPRSLAALWAACVECRSDEQLAALVSIWSGAVDDPVRVQAGVRPVGNAAARSGRLDLAIEIYATGLAMQLHGVPLPRAVETKRLQGRGAVGALHDIRDALTRAGIPFFYAAGTALGLVREGRPLRHDADIDIGVLEEHWDRAAVIDAFERHPMFLIEPIHPANQKVALRHRGGSPIDVFRFYREGGRVWHDGTFVRWWNSPFTVEERDVNGLTAPLPADAEQYLTESYGDWRTPDTAFDAFTGAPNVEGTWPAYRELFLLRRAYRRLSTGDRDAAMRDLAETRDLLAELEAGRQVLHLLDA